MHTLLVANRDITYDGRQLASHWIYRNFDLMGDAAVAFLGPCHVDLNEMVDIEDVKAQAPIFSPRMLHVIAEFFSSDLHTTVYRQRLLIVTAKELLETMTDRQVTRKGDDLYLPRADGSPGKLSVSITTAAWLSSASTRQLLGHSYVFIKMSIQVIVQHFQKTWDILGDSFSFAADAPDHIVEEAKIVGDAKAGLPLGKHVTQFSARS